ncbi:MAG: hypothetical protein ACFFG0_01045 [Candidatus Thorarchaeota archaeon]
MANLCIRVSVGKFEADEKGREYKFSIGDNNIKINNETILDLCEEAIEKKLTSIYGPIYSPRKGK